MKLLFPFPSSTFLWRRGITLRRYALLATLLLIVCSYFDNLFAQEAHTIETLPLSSVTPKTLNIRVNGSNGVQKGGSAQTHAMTNQWDFTPQYCDAPVVDTIGVILTITSPSGERIISGRVDSIRIISSSPFATYQIIAPTGPSSVNVTSPNGPFAVGVIARFTTTRIGKDTAIMRTYSVDSAGNAIPPKDFPIITTRGRRSFEVLTTKVDYGNLPPNTPSTLTFPFIRNTGTIPLDWQIPNTFGVFEVINISLPSQPSASNPGTARVVTLDTGQIVSLTVRFPGTSAGQYVTYATRPIDRICNVLGAIIEFEARTNPNPANITVTPTSNSARPLDFGTYLCSNKEVPYKDTTLTIYNSGQVTLRVTGASFSLPDYRVISPSVLSESSPLEIPFNQTRELIIRYTPSISIPNDRTGELRIFSNATTGTIPGVTTVSVTALKDSTLLTVSTQNVDFGTITRDTPALTRTFSINNTGTIGRAWILPQTLTNGFVVESISPNPTPAGSTAQATVRFANTSVAGQFSSVYNMTDDCGRVTPITMRINIDKPRPGIGVASPINFSTLTCTTDSLISFTVRNTSNDGQELNVTQMTILGGASSPFSLVAAPSTPYAIRSGTPQTLQIRFRPTRTGTFTDTLRFVSNADDFPTFNVVLQGTKESVGFTLSASNLNFINILPNTSLTQTLTIQNTGTTPISWGSTGRWRFALGTAFTIESISPQTTAAGSTSLVTVRFLGASVNPPTDSVTFTDPCNGSQSFTLQASILPPRISVTSSVQFAPLSCETESRSTITVRNIGGQDLTVSQITGAAMGISIDGLSGSATNIRLSAGRDTTLTVRYQPMVLGAANATFTYTSNAVNTQVSATTTTLSGVKNVRNFEFIPTVNPLFADFGKLPPNASSTQTFSLRNTGNLPIFWTVPIAFGDNNSFTVESVTPNPTPPGAMAQMVVKYRGSACGQTVFAPATTAILQGYGFQCNQNMNVSATATTEPATARLRLQSVSGGISDTVLLPIRLENAKFLREAGIREFTVNLRFNKTIMYPTGTDKGTTDATGNRIIPLRLPLPNPIPADSVLARIPFVITLGNTTTAQIFLDNPTAGGICINLDTASARTSAERICYINGTPRLIRIVTTATAMVSAKPNPVTLLSTIDLSLMERGFTTLTLYNTMGQSVKQLLAAQMEPGAYSVDVEAASLPSGVYFVVLQTPTERITRRLEVVR